MPTYLIALNAPDSAVWERVRSVWPDDHFILTDCLAFVSSDDSNLLTQDIAESLGMTAEDNVLGLVTEVKGLAGRNSTSFAEWLSKRS